MTLNLLLLGFGNVARRFVELVEESRTALDSLNLTSRVVGIATGRHGWTFDERGLDGPALAARVAAGDRLSPASGDPLALLERLVGLRGAVPVLVETTPLDVHTAEPALGHVRAALARRIHVITANKGPVALDYAALSDLAARTSTSFLFEGAVMDGIPVFNLVRETLPTSRINGFRGVVNSTTNFIIAALEAGQPFDEALAEMQAAGVAEADPSLDVDGWDAAAKAAAMANVWLDARTNPGDVEREGIGPSTAERARRALAEGRRLKLVATGRRVAEGTEVRVRLEELAPDDPLAIVHGQANALEIDTWPAGRIVITQRDGGLEKTAYALLADLVTLTRRLGAGR